MLSVRTNISSLSAQRNLASSTKELQASMAKLSSGSRINKAADDAAGMAVSENIRADIRSLDVTRRNANDGISLVQIAEGGFTETSTMLVRLRELAVQSASDTLGDKEREFLDKEFLQLKDEIDRVASSTEFNGTRLLIGDNDVAQSMKEGNRSYPLEIQVSKNYFSDVDGKKEADNPVNIIRIDLGKLNGYTHGDGSLNIGKAEEGTRVHDKTNAQNSIAVIDEAIYRVNEHRAYLGSVQNRLESSIRSLGVRIENLTESKSRIQDSDFASETAKVTQANILQQAGTSVLANANAQAQIALSLLG